MPGSEATHYDVLGVRPDASEAEIRRAYLEAARQSHPDIAGEAGEERMRLINEAWATLSDEESRALYDHIRPLTPEEDARLAAPSQVYAAHQWSGPTPPPRIDTSERKGFEPLEPDDEAADAAAAAWRFDADPVDERTAVGPSLQFLPPLMLIVALIVIVAGGVLSSKVIIVIGVILGALAAVSFLALPILAMGKAKAAEGAPRTR